MITGLPQKTYAKVFRLIVRRLQADPVLSDVVKTWMVWSALPIDRSNQEPWQTPSVRLTPQLSASDWYTPDSMRLSLQIKVEILLGGPTPGVLDADDCLNLWQCFEEAIYPFDRDDELEWEQALRDAGSETGQVKFNQPASIQSADETQFLCIGMMSVDVIRVISP